MTKREMRLFLVGPWQTEFTSPLVRENSLLHKSTWMVTTSFPSPGQPSFYKRADLGLIVSTFSAGHHPYEQPLFWSPGHHNCPIQQVLYIFTWCSSASFTHVINHLLLHILIIIMTLGSLNALWLYLLISSLNSSSTWCTSERVGCLPQIPSQHSPGFQRLCRQSSGHVLDSANQIASHADLVEKGRCKKVWRRI